MQRIQGGYSIYFYLLKDSLLTENNIWATHKKCYARGGGGGGVMIKMSNVRTYYWIPSLRKITKSIFKKMSLLCKI